MININNRRQTAEVGVGVCASLHWTMRRADQYEYGSRLLKQRSQIKVKNRARKTFSSFGPFYVMEYYIRLDIMPGAKLSFEDHWRRQSALSSFQYLFFFFLIWKERWGWVKSWILKPSNASVHSLSFTAQSKTQKIREPFIRPPHVREAPLFRSPKQWRVWCVCQPHHERPN